MTAEIRRTFFSKGKNLAEDIRGPRSKKAGCHVLGRNILHSRIGSCKCALHQRSIQEVMLLLPSDLLVDYQEDTETR
jgi:hypothetical protein